MTVPHPFEHLAEHVRPLMELPKPARIAACSQDRWVRYARAGHILEALQAMVEHPRSLRMPNILVVGRSGNGKSSICKRFVGLYPPEQAEDGTPIVKVVRAEVPGTPDESTLWSAMLDALLVASNRHERAPVKFHQLKTMLRTMGTKVLVLDEFNNIIRAGKKAGDLLAQLKTLSNELNLSIAAFGTPDAANALSLEPQMKSRFEPYILDRWPFGEEYGRFLGTYEKLLPLAKPSNLGEKTLARDMHQMAGDTIGGTVKLLKAAAIEAIESGEEQISRQLLARMDWHGSDAWGQISARA